MLGAFGGETRMNGRWMRWAAMAAVAVMCAGLALTGCESGGGGDDDPGVADFSGTITSVADGSIRIEENPALPAEGAKADLRIVPATVLKWSDNTPASMSDLVAGRQAQAWVAGPVAESYPVQGTASRIVITLLTN